jgi:Phosphotransferase enzyme family
MRMVEAPPADPGLPRLGALLDPEVMARVLRDSLPPGRPVTDVAVARVLYKPGRRATVHYTARVAGERHDAVARARAGADPAAQVAGGRYAAAAEAAGDRTPGTPAWHAPEVDAVVCWLPCDVDLPALVAPPAELARRVGAGGDVPQRLSYKPGARVVLRVGERVVKGYAGESQHARAIAGLRAGALPTTDFVGTDDDLRLTVQALGHGEPAPDAAAIAERAGALVRDLQATPVAGLAPRGAEHQLAEATARTRLLRTLVPELGPRLDRLVARLEATAPLAAPLVPAHGDLHFEQLLVDGDAVTVIDLDDMCLAPAALDLATYLADVVKGLGSDRAALDAVRAPLLEGYGPPPAELAWYLAAVVLDRASHPFQRLVPGWPTRIAGRVAIAEELVAG